MGIVARSFSLLNGIVVLAVAANANVRVNLLRRAGPKVGLDVALRGIKVYEKECVKGNLVPMLDNPAKHGKGKIKEVDEAGEGSVLYVAQNGDEAWVPIRALVGFENWVKGCKDCGGGAGGAGPAPGPPPFALGAPAPAGAIEHLTTATDFMYSGCQKAAEVNDPLFLPMGMTSSKCFLRCKKQSGAKYFGLTQGGICFCSELPPGTQTGSKQCDIKCSGNPKEICGGINKVASVYTMVNCVPKSKEQKGWLARARLEKLASLYETFEAQSCAQKKNNACELNGSSKMSGTPDECKLACWEAKGSEQCDGFTYNKMLSRCTFFKDVLDGKVKEKEGLTCYYKKLGYPMGKLVG